MNAPPPPVVRRDGKSLDAIPRGTLFFMVLLLGGLTAFGAFTIDLYIPALPTIAGEFRTDLGDVTRTMSVFFVGMALGQLVYGPLSDRVGRRPPLLFGCAVYVLASLACAYAQSLDQLILARFGQALGACAGVVVARAVVRDTCDTQESARLFSLLTLVLGVAPLLAPSAGAAILAVAGWRAIFLALAGFGLLLGLAVWRFLPESRGAETAAVAADERPWQSYAAVLREPRLLGFLLAGACNGAALFTYVAAASPLFIGHYRASPALFGVIFAVNAAGLIAASQVNRWLLTRYDAATVMTRASLAAAAGGAALLALALTGWGGMWAMMAAIFALLTSYGFVASNSTALALSIDPARSGSISAALGAASFACGAAASALVSMGDGGPTAMAAVMAGSLALSTLLLFALARPRSLMA